MDYPNISILVPTYNRTKFLPLFINNIKKQTYPAKLLEIVIDDDGIEPFTDDIEELRIILQPSKLIYFRSVNRRTIGEKRNNLVKLANSKILCNMDDDDIYKPQYIEYSFNILKKRKVGLVGSNQMLFTYPFDDFKMSLINCSSKLQIHEATMLFTKKYFRSMNGFGICSQGEGMKFINKSQVEITNIHNIMICVAHNNNTINKDVFNNSKNNININYSGEEIDTLIDILYK